jgi:Protein of unknown function DUF262/Protein of unknown function (DUF1524)
MQEKPDITAKNIAELFSAKEGTFRVPDYQRQYAWSDEEIEDLFDDLYAFHSELKTGGNQSYILGQAIFAPNNSQDSASFAYSIVDGQQRLTSLYLLTIMMRRWLGYFQVVGVGESLPEKAYRALGLILKYPDPMTGNENVRLAVAYRGDESITHLLEDTPLPEVSMNDTQANIRQNSQILDEKIRTTFVDDKEALAEFVHTVLYKVWIIVTRIDSESQALEIFDKINSRGKPLNSAELLKNLLFRQASEDQYKTISEDWNEAAEHVFKVRPMKAASMQYLMKSLLGARQGAGTSNRKVFDAWKEVLDESNEDMQDFAKDLNASAKFLSTVASSVKNKQNKHFTAVRYFKTVQQLPVVLAARDMQGSDSYETLCNFIDARILISLLAKEQPQTLERLIWPWAKDIKSLGANPSATEVLRASSSSIKDIEMLLQQAKLGLSSLDYRKSRDSRVQRFVLAAASLTIEHEAGDGQEFEMDNLLVKSKYDLDHIFAKSLVDSADFNNAEGKDWVHQIGNLTLLHSQDNRTRGASNPSDKSIDYGNGRLLLTNSLAMVGHVQANQRRLEVLDNIHGNHGQRVHPNWHAAEVREQTEAYWVILERYLKKQLGLLG